MTRLPITRIHATVTPSYVLKKSFCVLSIFKNEALGISEFIQHYKDEGCAAFFLLDNGSTDDYRLLPCFQDETVHILPAVERYVQIKHYNSVFKSGVLNAYDFVLIVDIDEYMFHKTTTLSQYIATIPKNVGQVRVYWSMFGSSGHIEQPKSIRESFTWRSSKNWWLTKALVRCNVITELGVHEHTITGNTLIAEFGGKLQLNHYAVQSREFFERVKMSRGDVLESSLDTFRNWDYFKSYDFKDVEDFTLRDRIRSS